MAELRSRVDVRRRAARRSWTVTITRTRSRLNFVGRAMTCPPPVYRPPFPSFGRPVSGVSPPVFRLFSGNGFPETPPPDEMAERHVEAPRNLDAGDRLGERREHW